MCLWLLFARSGLIIHDRPWSSYMLKVCAIWNSFWSHKYVANKRTNISHTSHLLETYTWTLSLFQIFQVFLRTLIKIYPFCSNQIGIEDFNHFIYIAAIQINWIKKDSIYIAAIQINWIKKDSIYIAAIQINWIKKDSLYHSSFGQDTFSSSLLY